MLNKYLHSFIPYDQYRIQAIVSQADQSADADMVIAGDSIVERALLPSLCNKTVLNVGIGGGTIASTSDLLTATLPFIRPKWIILSLGVNDTKLKGGLDADTFERRYRELVKLASTSGAQITLTTIAPVAQDMKLGAHYFDNARIRANNQTIRQIARDIGTDLVDVEAAMAGTDGYLPARLTVDGVHFNRTGYELWRDAIARVQCPMIARATPAPAPQPVPQPMSGGTPTWSGASSSLEPSRPAATASITPRSRHAGPQPPRSCEPAGKNRHSGEKACRAPGDEQVRHHRKHSDDRQALRHGSN